MKRYTPLLLIIVMLTLPTQVDATPYYETFSMEHEQAYLIPTNTSIMIAPNIWCSIEYWTYYNATLLNDTYVIETTNTIEVDIYHGYHAFVDGSGVYNLEYVMSTSVDSIAVLMFDEYIGTLRHGFPVVMGIYPKPFFHIKNTVNSSAMVNMTLHLLWDVLYDTKYDENNTIPHPYPTHPESTTTDDTTAVPYQFTTNSTGDVIAYTNNTGTSENTEPSLILWVIVIGSEGVAVIVIISMIVWRKRIMDEVAG